MGKMGGLRQPQTNVKADPVEWTPRIGASQAWSNPNGLGAIGCDIPLLKGRGALRKSV